MILPRQNWGKFIPQKTFVLQHKFFVRKSKNAGTHYSKKLRKSFSDILYLWEELPPISLRNSRAFPQKWDNEEYKVRQHCKDYSNQPEGYKNCDYIPVEFTLHTSLRQATCETVIPYDTAK